MPITPRDCVPRDWTRLLGVGAVGLGLDVATTEKDVSNPSSLSVTQQVGPLVVQRLVITWKTSREGVTRAIVRVVLMDLKAAGIRPRRLCIDGTNERFFAQRLAAEFGVFCPVEIVVASESMEWHGEKLNMKTILGNLYVSDFAEAVARMPDERFLKDDHRLVKKDKGLFVASVSPDGQHGDTFDSGKLARWALTKGGPAEISAVSVGKLSHGRMLPAGLKNPLLLAKQRQLQRTTKC
jgi:hypothetical protein